MDPMALPLTATTAPAASSPANAVNHERIQRLVEAHFDDLWRFARRLGVLEMDLDDVLQDVIMIAARRLPDIVPERERSFLFGTAFRVASEKRRWRQGRREVGDDVLAESEDLRRTPDVLLDEARARALLDRVLADMPTDLRAVFTLYEIEEMTMAEIADLLSLPPGTVASRLRRARARFEEDVARLQLGKEGAS